MSIRIRCPSGHRFDVAEHYAGSRRRCPLCREFIDIPQSTVAPGGQRRPASQRPTSQTASSRGQAGKASVRPPIHAGHSRPAPPKLPISLAATRPVIDRSTQDRLMAVHAAIASAAKPPAPPRALATTSAAWKGSAAALDTAQPERRATATALAAGIVMVALISMVPALLQGSFGQSPVWARAAVLLAVLEIAYAVWMVAVPDWSTVWITMIATAITAALYAVALAMTATTPGEQPLALGLDNVRSEAPLWCGAILVLTCFATYLCGLVSYRWRQALQTSVRQAAA